MSLTADFLSIRLRHLKNAAKMGEGRLAYGWRGNLVQLQESGKHGNKNL